MIRITICNHKGGTGKTTTSIQLAAALGLSGYSTLVVDLDPQAFLSRTLGLESIEESSSSLVLFDEDVLWHRVRPHEVGGFDVLPASGQLTRFQRKLTKPTDVFWAKEALSSGLSYDAVLFDTAAAITVYSLNALVASQYAVIPVTPEYQPVVGAEQTYQTTQMVQKRLNPDLHDPQFLFTQVDARKRSHHRYRSYLRKKYGPLVMENIIRTSTSLSTNYGDGGTVFQHAPHSRGARDYANAADEILTLVRSSGHEERRSGGRGAGHEGRRSDGHEGRRGEGHEGRRGGGHDGKDAAGMNERDIGGRDGAAGGAERTADPHNSRSGPTRLRDAI